MDSLGRYLLADPVISQFDQHLGLRVPLLMRQGEVPDKHIARFQISKEDVFGVEVGHGVRYLWREEKRRALWHVSRVLEAKRIIRSHVEY